MAQLKVWLLAICFGEALYHASLSQQEYRDLLAEHGFEVLKMIVEDAECAGHTVWLARKL